VKNVCIEDWAGENYSTSRSIARVHEDVEVRNCLVGLKSKHLHWLISYNNNFCWVTLQNNYVPIYTKFSAVHTSYFYSSFYISKQMLIFSSILFATHLFQILSLALFSISRSKAWFCVFSLPFLPTLVNNDSQSNTIMEDSLKRLL
jgi:hypothetical protein